MPLLKLWTTVSRGRYINIQRVLFFLVILYLAYILMDSFLPLHIVDVLFGCCITGLATEDFGNESITFIGIDK